MTGNARIDRAAAVAVFFLGVGSPFAAWAAGALTIRAALDRSQIQVGEDAQVTVIAEAEGVKLPEFALPAVPGLKIVRIADSQNFSWVNGKLSRSSTSIFLASAGAPGRYTIPPVRIASGSLRAQTAPLALEVGGAGAPPIAGSGPAGRVGEGAEPPRVWGDQSLPELFVRFDVDRRQVYWNQQIVARFIFYSRERLDEAPIWEIAEAPGFWKQELGEPRRGRVRVGEADYTAYEQDVAYFPTRTGRLRLGPGRITARVIRRISAPDPWSLLGIPETHVETIPLQTDRVPIEVLPLPGGALPGFRGAVGRLSMEVKVDRMVVRAGEPITVMTILRGEGNLNTAGDPDVTATLPLRSFGSAGSVSVTRAGLRIRGERRREKAFVPEVPGSFSIAPIRFTWFDPEEGRYRTQVSDPIRIAVIAAGDSAALAPPAEPKAALRRGAGPRGSLALGPPPVAAAVGTASMTTLAGALLLGYARRRAERDPKRKRRVELARIQRAMEVLRESTTPRSAAASRAAALVAEALGVRYGADVEGRSRDETLVLARVAGAPDATLEEARNLIAELERAAFAPSEHAGGEALPLGAAYAFLTRLAEERQ